jgi:hypothetical protein
MFGDIGLPIERVRIPGGTRRPPSKFAQDGTDVLAHRACSAGEIVVLEGDAMLHTKRRQLR